MLATVIAAVFAAVGFTSVAAQGTSNVECIPSYGWANNSLEQNPCLVAAWLQAECNNGAFAVNSIPAGYHYIGPTNVTSTSNACICSSPVYMMISACGACQNLTYITWDSWSFYCPASLLAPEGTYTETIPAGTVVPHWAYIKPSANTDDQFDPTAAQLVGDTPESSQIVSSTSTTSSSSTTSSASTTSTASGVGGTSGVVSSTTTSSSPTSSSGGGGGSKKSSTDVGAIAGGVVGGVIGLALVALLAFFLLKKRKQNNVRAAYGGAPASTHGTGTGAPPMSQHGGSYLGEGAAAGAGGAYVGSHVTGGTGGYQPTVGGSGQQPQYYDPSNPSTYPSSFPSTNTNAPGAGYAQPGAGGPGGYPQPGPGGYAPPGGAAPGGYGEHPAGRYSGMPEV